MNGDDISKLKSCFVVKDEYKCDLLLSFLSSKMSLMVYDILSHDLLFSFPEIFLRLKCNVFNFKYNIISLTMPCWTQNVMRWTAVQTSRASLSFFNWAERNLRCVLMSAGCLSITWRGLRGRTDGGDCFFNTAPDVCLSSPHQSGKNILDPGALCASQLRDRERK